MSTLPSDLRNKLERVIIEARDAAEIGARTALEALAVHHHEPYPHMKPEQRKLRNHLRARARQLGDRKLSRTEASGRDHEMDHLAGECAYEHWHRMLFARFLAENNLLIEPEENMAISLAEAEELAREEGVDVWVFASRCAQRMLPQIFRPDDPLLQISFATEHLLKLEKLLASLPAAVFTASDALGWVYQFWQTKRKKEVNDSEVKIGADEISAVTQLFTEPYMVEFLIHNTLGAWWAGKKLAAMDTASVKTEEKLRAMLALPGVTWDYLRFVRSSPSPSMAEGRSEGDGPWRPAAGTFDGWPKYAKHIKGLDPCTGSGHFLVALFHHLVPIRMIEEGLSTREAADAVLRDNIHGLEIDERCCQIAAFALALAAWTYPEAGGYRSLPELHIACTGIGPQATEVQWLKLAEKFGMPTQTNEQERVKNGLLNLHRLFSQAPTLGSLIDPKQLQADVFAADYETIQPYVEAVLKAEKTDDETHEQAIAAAGMVKAADLLAGDYALVITNVPYLARGKQSTILKEFCEHHFPLSRTDLATVFLERASDTLSQDGVIALVAPQAWQAQTAYETFRDRILSRRSLILIGRLGPRAFETISGEVVNVGLYMIQKTTPNEESRVRFVEAVADKNAQDKARTLRNGAITGIVQARLWEVQGHVISAVMDAGVSLLEECVQSVQGIKSGDDPWLCRNFWEMVDPRNEWRFEQGTTKTTMPYGGREKIIWWANSAAFARFQGQSAWDREGVIVNQMANLNATIFKGEAFDGTVSCIVPTDARIVPALWTFCSSKEYVDSVRSVDNALGVSNSSLAKVPFELAHWQKVAVQKYPDGLPEPESDDPTQWLFHGYPYEANEEVMLQVAVARLLGYRWPAELDDKMRLSKRARALVKQCGKLAKFADEDGIVCIPAVRGEDPAAERLLRLLTACDVAPGVDLDNWLRNSFFEEHCKLFHDRPFVWHIWDGRKNDGFHALVNYHKLCEGNGKGRRLLESLTYAYLGEWITRQTDGVKRGEEGAEDRLAAALELQKRLEAILNGEPPFDIFVRWKPLHEQSIGWGPDINDGVRLNIRPFLASDLPGGRSGAGVLRYKPNIKWTKDRGKEPMRPKAEYPWFWGWDEKTIDFISGKTFDGNRWNACHYTNSVKQRAQEASSTQIPVDRRGGSI